MIVVFNSRDQAFLRIKSVKYAILSRRVRNFSPKQNQKKWLRPRPRRRPRRSPPQPRAALLSSKRSLRSRKRKLPRNQLPWKRMVLLWTSTVTPDLTADEEWIVPDYKADVSPENILPVSDDGKTRRSHREAKAAVPFIPFYLATNGKAAKKIAKAPVYL